MRTILAALFAVCFSLPLVGDEKKDFETTKALAVRGDSLAQYNLGVMYANGDGVPEDDKEAAKWFRKAAEQGNDGAQFNLGLMYDYGDGVPEDRVAAYAWWSIAAVNGHEPSKSIKRRLVKKMTPEQLSKGWKLSREMVKKNPKLLK